MKTNELILASDVSVKEVRMGKAVEALPPASLSWTLAQGRISLSVPAKSRLEVLDSGFWRLLHDGRKWNRYGATNTTATLDFSFEYPAKFRLQCEGKTWILGPHNEKLLYKKGESGRLNKREWRLLATSLFIHVAIFSSILGFLSIPAVREAIDLSVKEKPEVKKVEEKKAGGGAVPKMDIRPFQGMTYAKFLNLLAAKEFAADPAAVLMKSMKKTTTAGQSPKVAQVGSALGGVDGAVASGGTSLSGQLAREKFMVKESSGNATGGASAKISEKQLAQLKAKFRDLQADFQRLYSKVLVSDSNLSVTVSLELLVQSSGYLSVASFKARGTSRPDSLEKLKRGMTEIIQSAFVGTEFAGISLRGENVFVR